jgi:hypothetical protein
VESHPRIFTREEAEALLPEVDRLLGELQAVAERLAHAESSARDDEWRVRSNGKVHAEVAGETPEAARRSAARQAQRLFEQIQGMGVVVRDVRTGLIDFPSERDGRIINLCWRRGEPLLLRWWHEVDAGFAGRQPLQDG